MRGAMRVEGARSSNPVRATTPEVIMTSGAKVGVVIVTVVALAAGAWWVWLRPVPVADGVVFVGDSVTYMSINDLREDLSRKHPQVLARVGFRSDELLPLFRDQVRKRREADEPLRQVVVLVGYNDVLQGKVPNPAMPKVMDLARQFDCAVWLELPAVPLRDDLTNQWNDQVHEAAQGHRNVHVVDDWRKAVEKSAPGELLSRKDGVHPTPAGARRLTEIFQKAINNAC
jgi:lysophospholipase L1-like esterase